MFTFCRWLRILGALVVLAGAFLQNRYAELVGFTGILLSFVLSYEKVEDILKEKFDAPE